MATKNHFSNYENLFSAYRDSVSTGNSSNRESLMLQISNLTTQLENLKSELNSVNNYLSNPDKKAPALDTRKSDEFLPRVKKAEQVVANLKAVALSDSRRADIEKELDNNKESLNKTKQLIASLTVIIDDASTDSKTRTSSKSRRTKAENLSKAIEENIKKLSGSLSSDNETKAKIVDAENNLRSLNQTLNAIKLDEKQKTRQAIKNNDKIVADIENKKARQRAIIPEKNKLEKEIAELKSQLTTIPQTTVGSVSDFKKFLSDNNLSTVHADELYNLLNNPNYNIKISEDDFKLRKQHPKRDKFIKKFLVPMGLTAGAVGITSGSIAAAQMISGSKWLFVTITSDPITNFIKVGLLGAGVGAAAAYGTIKIKDAITKQYYKSKYGDVNKIINNPESAKLEELIEKIENTTDEVLDLRTGRNNIFSKLGRAIKRTNKNIVNRNRIHHIESLTEKLVEKFDKINSNQNLSVAKKLELTTPIYNALEKIGNFYDKDIKKSKIFTLLNCKETSKNHTHKVMIENLDIYSKLSMFLEENKAESTKSDRKKLHKQIKTDLKKQNITAGNLLNGGQVTSSIERKYHNLLSASDTHSTPDSKKVANFQIVDNALKVNFANGKSTSYDVQNAQNISQVKSTNLGKNLLITYLDGSQTSIQTVTPKQRINLNVAGEFTILERLNNYDIENYLISKGYDLETITRLRESLYSSKYNKNGKKKAKPSTFTKSKAYKENSEYAKIFEDVVSAIKNPNSVEHIDFNV